MLQKRGKDKWLPPCWYEACHTAQYQYKGVRLWIEFLYLILQASNLSESLVLELLEQADAKDGETIELVVLASTYLRAGLREKEKRDRERS